MSKAANPFKFGTVVDGEYFTNRTREIAEYSSIINGQNHLVLIGPRRFGKTSLIRKITAGGKRPVVHLDAYMITSPADLAAQLVSRLFRLFPLQRIKEFLKSFTIVPTITINPVSGETEISFGTRTRGEDGLHSVEDAFNLVEKLSKPSAKLIVVIDEFQEILKLDKQLDRHIRSVIQHHKNVNYVFTGSQESMMRDMFEDKKSPFYHFGVVRHIERIPREDFSTFLSERFDKVSDKGTEISEGILYVTDCHPYYTQQLAWQTWEEMSRSAEYSDNPEVSVGQAVEKLVRMHDFDYDRMWSNFNTTDRKILVYMAGGTLTPLSSEFLQKAGFSSASTASSALKRLIGSGYLTQEQGAYRIDDPFFSRWINIRRNL
ncbi:MAG: ATP-binding protein [Balneolales bacterium]|nr:ATP-binding protein [Balneolales bacterium]